MVKAVEGGSAERLVTRPNPALRAILDAGWFRAGVHRDCTRKTSADIWLLPLSGDRQPVPMLATRFCENHAEFSPNGRWLAYTSDESGRS